jgi:alkylation response protein AidB-like acyl-CoA dehydrogenase
MNFAFTKEEESLIQEVRVFLKKNVTSEFLEETRHLGPIYGGQVARKFMRAFAAKGWLVPHWPEEYGGLGASEMVNYVIRDEFAYVLGLQFACVAAHIAGPTIMRFASEEMKERFLIPIAKGDIEFALGYTEPDAGSDLMSLRTYAEDKDDFFIVNGNKTFNTHCHIADYHWLAVRTDPEAHKHKGISLLIVDLNTPGITINPMITMGGYRTNEVFYDNVRVPKENLVGEMNRGGYYVMAALDFERMFPPNAYRRLFEDVLEYTKETKVDGHRLCESPLVRQKLAQMSIELEVAKLLYYRLAYMLDKDQIPNYQSSMEKTFACEMAQRISRLCMEILGPYGSLREGSKWAQLAGRVEHYYRMSVVETIYGGSSEIQRNIMAQRGLGLGRG